MKKIFVFILILFLPFKVFSWTPEFALENKKSGDIIFENIGVSKQEVLEMKKNGTIYYYIDFYKIFGKISQKEYITLKNYIFTDNSLNQNIYKKIKK